MSSKHIPMAEQQAQDLAAILAAFPDSKLGADGSPTIAGSFTDVESDPVTYTIDSEGCLSIDTWDSNYMLLNAQILLEMAAKCRQARELWSAWEETPSGKAWAASIYA